MLRETVGEKFSELDTNTKTWSIDEWELLFIVSLIIYDCHKKII